MLCGAFLLLTYASTRGPGLSMLWSLVVFDHHWGCVFIPMANHACLGFTRGARIGQLHYDGAFAF